jgi:hypothetical protein
MITGIALVGGIGAGWYLRTLYQRGLYDASRRIRRAMRGGKRRRRH